MSHTPGSPFNEDKLHVTVKKDQAWEDREPFNDVIRHGDVIQGFQAPKQFEQIPKWYRNPRRIFATISLVIFASTIIYQLLRTVFIMVTGR